jgi:hypothetical protein
MEDRWDIFLISNGGVPGVVANGVCVRELGRTNRKETLLERFIKY